MSAVFDLGPLTWVKSEIDSSLDRAKAALHAFGANPADAAPLKTCAGHVHQAAGAVQIVGLEGVSRFFGQTEQVLAELEANKLEVTPAVLESLERAIDAIGGYLTQLIAGAPDQPLRLFPEYRRLAELRGGAAPSESELFFPDLNVTPPPREQPGERVPREELDAFYRSQRTRYQRGFLRWLRDPSAANALEEMRAALAAVEAVQPTPALRSFWWVAVALCDALASGDLAPEPGVKQLAGRFEQQLRRAGEGSATVPEALLREALYWLAHAAGNDPRVRAAKRAYKLDTALASEPAAQETPEQAAAARALQEAIGAAKDVWTRIAAGEEGVLAEFSALAAAIGEHAQPLGDSDLAALAAEVGRAAAQLESREEKPSEAASMEVATALLVLENAASHYGRPSEDFARQVGVVTERLGATVFGTPHIGPLPTTGLVDEMTQRAQERLAAAGAYLEIQANLQRVEQALDAYFRDPALVLDASLIDAPIQQVIGAFRMLGEEEARGALERCAAKIRGFSLSKGRPPQEDFEEVAQLLSGLGFYVDALRHGKADFATAMRPIGAPAEAVEAEEAAAEAGQEEDTGSADEQAGPARDEAEFETLIEVPKMAPPAAAVLDEEGETLDEELLGIFLEEAHLVLAAIADNLAACGDEPASVAHLTGIRRSFHTLKGSGRMVGLMRLGQTAWAMEQVMNQWLQEERSATPELIELVEYAQGVFTDWVARLRDRRSQPDAQALIDAAERLRRGEPLQAPDAEGEEAPGATAAEEEALDFSTIGGTAAEGSGTAEAGPAQSMLDEAIGGPAVPDEARLDPGAFVPAEAPYPADAEPPPAEFAARAETSLLEGVDMGAAPESSAAAYAPEQASDTVQVGDASVSSSLFAVFVREASQYLESLEHELAAVAAHERVSDELVRVAHTFAGICGTVQIQAMHALGHALESALLRLRSRDAPPSASEVRLLAYCVGTLRVMYGDVTSHRSPRARDDLVVALEAIEGHQPPLVPLPEGADTVAPPALPDELASEASLPSLAEAQQQEDASSLDFAAGETADASAETSEESAVLEPRAPRAGGETETPEAPDAPEAGTGAGGALDTLLEDATLRELVAGPTPSGDESADSGSGVDFARAGGAAAPESPEPAAEEVRVVTERRQRRIEDDLDAQLLPVFLAEAHELAPQAGELLRAWRRGPENKDLGSALQRVLHTFKGGARMAGAMSLGELTHSMETRVENAIALESAPAQLFDDLDASYDRMGVLLERLQHPPEAEPAPAAPGAAPEAAVAPPAATLRESMAARALLRVPAEILEKLVNRAGEVSIARSRIEAEVRGLKESLSDLTENVARLRGQLREIEIQAESQMQAREREAAQSRQAFDPLELDRFTRFQEITRMMAESVNDVATVQQNIVRALGDSESALSVQARLSRELQQDLMRVRMVPVNSATDRLHRLVRRTAKELGKRAHLEIRGAAIELDRSVLERITGPLEHLLRNAVIHGIEDAARRSDLGKPEFGEVRIDVRQEGNEVVLAVSDDGAGLDLELIRARALERGLLAEGEEMADQHLAQLIFIPGFTTAKELTEVAGRGVGMDVVREEVRALGGRVEIANTPGQGVAFTIRLPLTTAVTQAVLVKSGARTCALPAVMVDQVRRLKPEALEQLRAEGGLEWAGRQYPFAYLPELLGEPGAPSDEALRRAPLVLIRSGADTAALLVDDLVGNQEVVVKNLGPQLMRVPGLAAITVLGSGEIVMILNPVPLLKRPHLELTEPAEPVVLVPRPRRRTVMVVDDSLTVRKITGRLLAREGYHVMTAKDGVDALEQLEDVVPVAMLIDIEMPRMDGLDLTRNLRADARLARVPIIMITSRTAEKHRDHALDAGVDVFLGKPYREDELLAQLDRLVGEDSGAG